MKVRILSAIVALAIIIPFVIIGDYPFAGLMGVLAVLGYKEVLDLKKGHQNIPIIVKILGLFSLVYLILADYGINSLYMSINNIRLLVPLFLLLFPTVFYKNDKYTTHDAFYLLGFVYLIGLLFHLIIVIRNINIYILVYLLCITMLTDTFAYIIGSLIGKHKMAPKISPKKSWEGAVGGLIGSTIISLIVYANLLGKVSFKVVIATMILSVVGQIGDLVFSKIKRDNDIKDFSNIMPGHGGILDRLDSITFVVFAYVIITYIF